MTRTSRKPPRDPAQLSGKPLAETLEPSPILHSETEDWTTSRDLTEHGLLFVPEVMQDLTLYLLANPNVNSSHLFRADILFDSEGIMRTPREKAQSFALTGNANAEALASTEILDGTEDEVEVEPTPARDVPGFTLTRTIVRRLVPRNPKLDRTLDQTCHFYEAETTAGTEGGRRRSLVIYTPHITKEEDIPYYHPTLRSLAYLYDYNTITPEHPSQDPTSGSNPGPGTLTLHTLLFRNLPITNRLERTLQALLNTQIRLARTTRLPTTSSSPSSTSTNQKHLLGANKNPLKDNILPQHLVQDTYTRLKAKYASDLCQRWVETTEPSKHVFEDLSIAAFLIELWRSMYGVVPSDERSHGGAIGTTTTTTPKFPGFVDVACGNGVLVYILLQEGYEGWGFDARRRKTWAIFPERIQSRLKEEIYIPAPFSDAVGVGVGVGEPSSSSNPNPVSNPNPFNLTVPTHTGHFPANTFIISNHADELTVWTPLMAALLCPRNPSPFVAIPCCSHALSGAKYRYPPPRGASTAAKNKEQEEQQQPDSGDLKALRKERQDAQASEAGFLKSMYGSLTAKTMAVAEEVGYEVEKTLLRIPSTRNMAVVGGRRGTMLRWKGGGRELTKNEAQV
ncbi:tRNA (uracil) methyltransferase, partial [Aspergillus fijiensis CBS 313.89]